MSTSNLTSVATIPEGWRVITVNQGQEGGIGSSAFGNLGSSLGPRPITALLARNKASDAQQVLIGSFSAGWGLVNAIGQSEERDDPRLRAVVLADSYYKSFARIAAGGTQEGITHLARRAAHDGGAPVWLTTSAIGGPDYASASKSVETEIERWGLVSSEPHAELPPPKRAMARGSLLWHDYGDLYGLQRRGHLVHATELGPKAVDLFLRGSSSSPPSRRGGGGGVVAICALLLFAYFAAKG